jgi:hypothetical protein
MDINGLCYKAFVMLDLGNICIYSFHHVVFIYIYIYTGH